MAICPDCGTPVQTGPEHEQRIENAAMELIHHLAGEQCSEEEIDAAFNHPGLGRRVNALRAALGVSTR